LHRHAETEPSPLRGGPSATDWLVGGGETGELVRSRDWSATPLGPVEAWPQSLRSAVSILLPSRAPICLFWGPELVAIYNDTYRPALGVKHPRALGRPAREVWSESWNDVLRPLLEGVLDSGEAFWASDYPLCLERHGYPEETYFDISYDPVRNETGRVGGVFCIVSETTGRALGERRLRVLADVGRVASEADSEEEVFRLASAVLEANPHDFAFAGLFDEDGRPVAACRLESLEGWPLAEARARGDLLLRGEDLRRFGRLSGGAWPEPATAALVLPMAVPGRTPCGFLVAGASPRRRLDDSYCDYLRLVASRVAFGAARARALAHDRARAGAPAGLDHATDAVLARREMSRLRREAEAASRTKDEFLAMLSHELHNPLAPIVTALELMRLRGQQSPEIDILERQAGHLTRLVDDLLDVSRITRRRIQLHKRRMELSEAVDKALETASPLIEQRRQGVDAREVAREGLAVDADPDRLAQIVSNLVTNAAKHSDPSSSIVLRAGRRDGRVWLAVRDHGVGIAPDMIERIFDLFVQHPQRIERSEGGLGLGLTIVRHLTELHGGRVWARSEGPGRGSEFTVELPAAHSAPVADPVPPLAPEPVARPVSKRILVVDDNRDAAETLGELLRHMGHEVVIAHDGASCLALAKELRPDVAFVDIGLPGVDGYGVARQLRQQQASEPRTKLVAITGYGQEADRRRSAGAGFDHHLVKPVDLAELRRLVSES
jgi:signal transduction histidine kinase/CheY-like chemotaxis protein